MSAEKETDFANAVFGTNALRRCLGWAEMLIPCLQEIGHVVGNDVFDFRYDYSGSSSLPAIRNSGVVDQFQGADYRHRDT